MAFTGRHTPERRAKISAALIKRWATNPTYRATMLVAVGQKKPLSHRLKLAERGAIAYNYETLSAAELGYIAGIIDGEGTISVVKKSHRDACTIHLSVTNTKRELLEWLLARLAGHISNSKSGSEKWADKYCWLTSATHAASIIRCIRPYLVIKAGQADLALEFMEHRFDPLENQLQYRSQMKVLNRRGRLTE